MSNFPVIEWAPEACLVSDPGTHKIASYVSPVEALAALGRPRKIVLALGRRQTFVKSIRLPDVPVEEARNLLRFRLDDLFPIPGAEAAYDVIATGDINHEGREFIVLATKTETLIQARSLFAHAGAKVEQVVPAALGGQHIADTSIDCLLVSPCAEGLAFDAFHHGHLAYSRVGPYPSTQAEMEVEIGRSAAAAGIANPLVVAHSSLNHLVTPEVRLTDEHPLSNLNRHPVQTNLRLPEDLAKLQSSKLNARKRLALILGLAAVAAAAIAWSARDEDMATEATVRENYRRQIDAIKGQKDLINVEASKLKVQSDLVVDGIEPKQHLADVVTVAANAAPDGLWLTGLSIERGKDLTVRGTATSNTQVAAFVDSLSATPRLRDVHLAFSNNNNIADVPVVQFSVTAHVVGNMPLTDPKKTKKAGRK
ncbi:MAG: PilN domain-containing protein [Armatimonadetes bacterium]|nr:PilN domain-containing protein [Armatimonadota bacterium]